MSVMHAAKHNLDNPATCGPLLRPIEDDEWVQIELPLGIVEIACRDGVIAVRAKSDHGRLTIRPEVTNEFRVTLEDRRINTIGKPPKERP